MLFIFHSPQKSASPTVVVQATAFNLHFWGQQVTKVHWQATSLLILSITNLSSWNTGKLCFHLSHGTQPRKIFKPYQWPIPFLLYSSAMTFSIGIQKNLGRIWNLIWYFPIIFRLGMILFVYFCCSTLWNFYCFSSDVFHVCLLRRKINTFFVLSSIAIFNPHLILLGFSVL